MILLNYLTGSISFEQQRISQPLFCRNFMRPKFSPGNQGAFSLKSGSDGNKITQTV